MLRCRWKLLSQLRRMLAEVGLADHAVRRRRRKNRFEEASLEASLGFQALKAFELSVLGLLAAVGCLLAAAHLWSGIFPLFFLKFLQ